MGRANQSITVEVDDLGNQNGERKLVVRLGAKADLFSLSDMLVREHVIKELDTHLKVANRKALLDFAASGKMFVQGMTKEWKKKSGQR